MSNIQKSASVGCLELEWEKKPAKFNTSHEVTMEFGSLLNVGMVGKKRVLWLGFFLGNYSNMKQISPQASQQKSAGRQVTSNIKLHPIDQLVDSCFFWELLRQDVVFSKTPKGTRLHSSRWAGPLKAAKPCGRASGGGRGACSVDWYETCGENCRRIWACPTNQP